MCVFLCVGLCVYVSTFVQCVHMRVKTNQPWVSYLKAIHLGFWHGVSQSDLNSPIYLLKSYVSNPSHYTGLSCVDSEDVMSPQLHLHQLLSTSKYLDLANPITLIPWMLLSLSTERKSKTLEMQIRFCFWLLLPMFLRTLQWDPSDEMIFFSMVQALHGLVTFSHFLLSSLLSCAATFSTLLMCLHPFPSCLSNSMHPATIMPLAKSPRSFLTDQIS